MPGGEEPFDQTVSRADLTEFRGFLLDQLKSHTEELSAKFEKASNEAESALLVSKQLKAESKLKFAYPGNERNYKFHFEIVELLETAAIAVQDKDTPKASQIISQAISSLKERNRKIRIADSSEGGWLTVKHYESNAVALDLEDDKKIRAAEREALRDKNRTRVRRNAERLQGRYQPYSQPFGVRGQFQRPQFSVSPSFRSQQQPPDFYNQSRGACRFLVLYLDDGAGCEKEFLTAKRCADAVRSDLDKAGLVANHEKSIWVPVHCLEWLGISWDLDGAFLSIPQPRIDRLLAALSAFKGKLPYVTPRFVGSIVGKIISLSPCVGNVSLIMSRFLQSAVSLRDAWDTPLDLSRFQHYLQYVDEIAFWLVNCPNKVI